MSINTKKLLAQMLFLIIAIIIVILFSRCNTTKHTLQTIQSIEQKNSVNVDSLVKAKVDSVRVTIERSKTETSTGVIFDHQCDSVFIHEYDSIPIDRIVYKSDGSFEATGIIKSYTLKISDWQKKYDSLSLVKTELDSLNKSLLQSTSQTTTVKTEDKTAKVSSLWRGIIVIIAFLLGTIFGWKIISKL